MAKNDVLRFYNAVYQEFPTDRLLELIDLIANDTIDCWRGAGVAIDAISAHAHNSRGFFNLDKYERSRERLNELAKQFAPNTMFQI